MYNAKSYALKNKSKLKIVVATLNAHQNLYIFICKYSVFLV